MRSLKFTLWHEVNLKFLLWALISRVNSQNDTTTSLTAASTTTTLLLPVVECNNTQKMVDECFKNLPPYLMEFLQTTKIATNEQDITSKCTVFHHGMDCFDEYTARCLKNTNLNIFKNNVEGARNFFIKFCDDRGFQEDYLRHKDCLSYIQKDWLRCTKHFQNIVSEELHLERTNITKKFMEFCCARRAYETCIYNSARYKCYPRSVDFARDMAKTLSDEKHFSNCRQYEDALCRAGYALCQREGSWRLQLSLLLSLMLLIQLMLRCQP